MTKKNKIWIGVLVGLIVILMAVAAIKARMQPKGTAIEVETVATRTITEIVSASGKVFPTTEVKISSDVSGEIVELYVKEGDSVRAGQLLAKIDPDAYESQVERGLASVNSSKAQAANAKAQIENFRASKAQIQAQLENAKEIHRRNEQLKKDGFLSQADFDGSLSNLRTLEANLRSAEANINGAQESTKAAEFTIKSTEASLKELKTSLKRTAIYAPITGIVSLLNVKKGERVLGTIQMSGTEIMRIADLSVMEVQVEVSENEIPRVTLGDTAVIEVDAFLGRKFTGKVSEIANSAANLAALDAAGSLTTDQVTNFVVTLTINQDSYQDLITAKKPYPFRPGMSASVDIQTNTVRNTLAVPIQAVATRDRDGDDKKDTNKDGDEAEKADKRTAKEKEAALIEVVFIHQADTVQMLEVKSGLQDDKYIQIVSGLKAGQSIVIGPYAEVSRKLKSGDKVHIKVEEEKTEE